MNEIYPWQIHQWQQLLSQYHQQRLGHAFLVCGPSGLGKFYFAQKFAQLLFCKQRSEYACGNCSGCRLLIAENHPDLLKIVPEEAGKNIKVEQVRQIIDLISKTSQRIGYKIVIISPAEALNKAAANALLKSLEEPSGSVIFFLISHQPGILPATIRSRCQKIVFLGQSESHAWLSQQLKNSDVNMNVLLKVAEFAPLRALELANNGYLSVRDQLAKHLFAVAQKKTSLLTPVAEYLKQDIILWTEAFISLLTDLIRLKLAVEKKWLVNEDCIVDLKNLSQLCHFGFLLELSTQLISARQHLQNVQIHLNNQLLVESLLIGFQKTLCLQ